MVKQKDSAEGHKVNVAQTLLVAADKLHELQQRAHWHNQIGAALFHNTIQCVRQSHYRKDMYM